MKIAYVPADCIVALTVLAEVFNVLEDTAFQVLFTTLYMVRLLVTAPVGSVEYCMVSVSGCSR